MATFEATNEFFKKTNEYASKNAPEIEHRMAVQRDVERNIIAETDSFCPYAKLEPRRIFENEFAKALKDGYGDRTILHSLLCMNNSIAFFPRSAGLRNNFKIREYIQALYQIGETSTSGVAMTAVIQSVNDEKSNSPIFVVKAPLSKRREDDPIHEYFVGAFGTNYLRNYIPNFSFVLGMFKCSPPFNDLEQNKVQALTYCQNDNPENQVTYLIYENVADSVSLSKFIRTCSFSEYLNVITQIVLALGLAYRKLDFTHYDLHTKNILVRKLASPIVIRYEIDQAGSLRYLKTQYVATIIDYGRCHIQYGPPLNRQNFGFSGYSIGIFPGNSYPMHDIFKLLCFSLMDTISSVGDEYFTKSNFGIPDQIYLDENKIKNKDVFSKARIMLRFFNSHFAKDAEGNVLDAMSYLGEMWDKRFSLPYITVFNVSPLVFYQRALAQLYPEELAQFLSEEAPSAGAGTVAGALSVYGCKENGICKSFDQAILDYTRSDGDYINNPFIFFEMLLEYERGYSAEVSGNIYALEKLLLYGQENYYKFQDELLNQRVQMISRINEMISNIKIYSISSAMENEVRFSDKYLDNYRQYLDSMTKAVDLATTIRTVEDIMIKFNDTYPELSMKKIPNRSYSYAEIQGYEFSPFNGILLSMNNAIDLIKRDVDYITSLYKDPILKFNPNTVWLFNNIPSLNRAIAKFK